MSELSEERPGPVEGGERVRIPVLVEMKLAEVAQQGSSPDVVVVRHGVEHEPVGPQPVPVVAAHVEEARQFDRQVGGPVSPPEPDCCVDGGDEVAVLALEPVHGPGAHHEDDIVRRSVRQTPLVGLAQHTEEAGGHGSVGGAGEGGERVYDPQAPPQPNLLIVRQDQFPGVAPQ